MEIWRDIPDYEGLYMVSNYGRVKSLPRYVRTVSNKGVESVRLLRERIMKGTDIKRHITVKIMNESEEKRVSVARLVLQVFGDEPDYKYRIGHVDGDYTNNSLGNIYPKEVLDNT